MKKNILPLAFILITLISCSPKPVIDGNEDENGLEPLVYTLYTEKTELFVEFNPLIVGQECRFAAHFTELGESFKALAEGSITLTANVGGKEVSVTASEPQVPGIFRLRLTPDTPGNATLTFDIKAKTYTDQVIIENVKVYTDEKAAIENQSEESNSTDITYLKEQAWKVEFANVPVVKTTFNNIIKASGQILAAPGDEIVVSSNSRGIVLFTGNRTIIGSEVKAGTGIFTISGGELTEGNINVAYNEARATFEKAQADYLRSSELVKDKIISQKDFLQAKLDFENAQINFNTVSKNYTSKGQGVVANTSGFIKHIYVKEGQYVEKGSPLAIISRNRKLILQANVSQKYFRSLPAITSANFISPIDSDVYETRDLNGRIISYGRSASVDAPFVPVTFEIDNSGKLIPGSVVEVYLKSDSIPDALVVPVSALIEEQGKFFVYVQTGGESFQKREVEIGASDAMNVQILSGISEGERVVIKGGYQIKLSSAAGVLPAHGHEH